jgi:hypothetical protein
MSDKEFDKHFSKKLSEDLPFPFNTDDWEKLSDRLNTSIPQKQATQSRKWHLLWLLPLLLLVGSGLFFALNKLNNLQNENQNLSQQLSGIKSLLEKKDAAPDLSILHKQQRDTIIIIKYLPQPNSYFADKLPTASPKTTTPPPSVNEPFLQQAEPTERGVKAVLPIINQDSAISDLNNKVVMLSSVIEQLTAKLKETEQMLTSAQAQKQDSLKNKITDISNAPPQPSTPQNIITPTSNQAPNNRFFVGLSGGLIYYKSKWFNRDNIEISRNEQSWQAGIRAEYALNQRWRLMFGGDFCPFDINITWSDGRYNLPEPPLADYPASQFTLKYRAARQELVQGFLGIKHIFTTARWRPYIGLAHTTMKILPFETTFDFQDLRTWKSTDVVLPSDGKLISNLILLNGGWEWQMTKRWLLQAEGFYYRDMHKTKRTYDQYGIRMSLMRGF